MAGHDGVSDAAVYNAAVHLRLASRDPKATRAERTPAPTGRATTCGASPRTAISGTGPGGCSGSSAGKDTLEELATR